MLNINYLPPTHAQKQPYVSVIIPVYGVERWIERCARSLFEQTLDSIEYIFVDDCSPDASITVLKRVLADYPNRQPRVRIIRHETNQGVAAARTTGMKAATGLYMIHCDPDDWVEPQAYQLMFEKAKATNADIVTCGYYKNYEDETQSKLLTIESEGIGKELLLRNFDYGSASLCTKLIRTNIIKQYEIYPFPRINSGEDLNVSVRAYYYSNYVTHISFGAYHYFIRSTNSITATPAVKLFKEQNIPNIEAITNWISHNCEKEYSELALYLKLNSKMKLLYSKPRYIKLWRETWPEASRILNKVKNISKATRFTFKFGVKYPIIIWIYFKYLDFRNASSLR